MEQLIRTICVAIAAMLALVAAFLQSSYTPGFFVPFINHPICRMAILLLLAWECIGMVLLFKSRDHKTWWLYSLIFGQPLLLLTILAPYALFAVHTVGPYMDVVPCQKMFC